MKEREIKENIIIIRRKEEKKEEEEWVVVKERNTFEKQKMVLCNDAMATMNVLSDRRLVSVIATRNDSPQNINSKQRCRSDISV